MGSYNLGTAAGRIIIDASGASRGFQVAQQAGNVFFDAVRTKADSIRNVGQNLQKVGAAGVTGFGMAIKSAADFEERISAVGAVSGASAQEMDQIRSAALRIGKDTSFSATQAASAMEELVKAGISTKDILGGAADATVALAAAGEISLPRAAEIASAAMNNFNMTGKDMPHVADLIAGAANASAIDVGDFGESLKQVGAVANLAGLSFDDTSVAIAEMGQAGIKGSDAGTSLKTMLMNMQPSTKKAAAQFKDLGIITADGSNKFYDAHGKLKKLSEIQEILRSSLEKLNPAQRQAALETMFGADAIRAAAILSKDGAKGYNEMSAAMKKVGAEDVANKRLDNPKGSIEKMKGSLETAAITIGSVFLPVVRKIVDGITALIDKFNSAPAGVQKFIAILAGAAAVAAGVIGTIITVGMAMIPMIAAFIGKMLLMSALRSVFAPIRAGFMALRAGAPALATVGNAATGMGRAVAAVGTRIGRFGQLVWRVFSGVRTVASFAFGPWGIAIAVVIGALVLLYNKCEWFRNLVNSIGSAIKAGFSAAMDGVKAAIDAVVQGFNGAASSSNPIIAAFQNIGKAGRYVWDAIKSIGNVVMTVLWPAMQKAGSAIKEYFLDKLQEVWKSISGSVIPAFDNLKKAFSGGGDAIGNIGKVIKPVAQIIGFSLKQAFDVAIIAVKALIKVFSALMPVFTAIAKVVIDVFAAAFKIAGAIIGGVIGVIAGVVNVLVGLFTGDFSRMGEGIKQIFTSIVNAIKSILGTLWSTVKSIVMNVVNGVIGFFTHLWDVLVGHSIIPDMVNAIIEWIAKLPGAILDLLKTLVQKVIDFFTFMWTGVQAAFQAAWTMIVTVLTTIWSGILAVAQGVWGGILAFFSGLWSGIQAAWSAIWNAIIAFLQMEWNGIQVIATTVWNALVAFFSAIWAGVQAAWNAAWTAIQTALTTVWNLIVLGAQTVWNGIITFFSTLWSGIQTAWNAVWAAISAALSAVWNAIVAAGKFIIQGWVNILTGIWSVVQTAWSAAWNAISATLSAVWNGIKAVATAVWNGIKAFLSSLWNSISSLATTVWNGIKTSISTILNAIRSVVTTVWNGIKSFISTVLNGIKAIVTTVWNGIKSTITTVLNAIKSTVSNIWNGIKSVISNVLNGIKSTVSTIWNGIKTTISNSLNNIKTAVSNGMNTVKTTFTDAWNSVKTTVTTKIGEVVANVREIPGKCKSALGNLGSTLMQAGKDLINGFINGIKSTAGNILSTIKNSITDKIPGWVKGPLGINSPSRVMIEIARWIPIGIAKGIKDNTGQASDAARSMGVVVAKAASLAVNRVTKAATKTVSAPVAVVPKIQPLIDARNKIEKNYDSLIANLSNKAQTAMRRGDQAALSSIDAQIIAASRRNKSAMDAANAKVAAARKLADAAVSKAGGSKNPAIAQLQNTIKAATSARDNMIKSYNMQKKKYDDAWDRAHAARNKSLEDSITKQARSAYLQRLSLEQKYNSQIASIQDKMVAAAQRTAGSVTASARAADVVKKVLTAVKTTPPPRMFGEKQLETFKYSSQARAMAQPFLVSKDDGSAAQRPKTEVTFNVYNPVEERTSQTAVKQMNRAASLGVFG